MTTATDTLRPAPRVGGPYEISHLEALEAESVHIFREVAGEFERPVILFSGGKDSIVMLHLALKA
ncbi:sulfate adenylyltransferase small subunit, partial [Kitasatospora aureofaciens]|nr:sulfate adenylyltransferase small subunit [Kitasatospora aureofaciens]